MMELHMDLGILDEPYNNVAMLESRAYTSIGSGRR